MNILQPSLIIGLGDYAANVVKDAFNYTSNKNRDLLDVLVFLSLKNNGEWINYYDADTIFKIQNLSSAKNSKVSDNYKAILNGRKAIEGSLLKNIKSLRTKDTVLYLQSNGYDIGDITNIYIIAPLFDAVGSAAIIPILEIIHSLFSNQLEGFAYSVTLIGLLPDLYDKEKDETSYKRFYASMQEIEFIQDYPDVTSSNGRQPLDLTFLVSAYTIDNLYVGSIDDVAPFLSQLLYFLSIGTFSDISFSVVLMNRIEGKVTRYNSFGFSRLYVDKGYIFENICSNIGGKILANYGIKENPGIEENQLWAEAKKFLNEINLINLYRLLELDYQGRQIWKPLKLFASEEKIIQKDYSINASRIKKKLEYYDNKEYPEIISNLMKRKKELLEEKVQEIDEYLKNKIREKHDIYIINALINYLLFDKSEHVAGNALASYHNYNYIIENNMRFFDDEFQISRDQFRKLVKEINDKELYKERLTKDIEDLENQIESFIKEEINTDQEVDIKEVKLEELNKKLNILKEQLNKANKEINKLITKKNKYYNIITKHDSKITDPTYRRAKLNEKIVAIRNDIKKLEDRLKEIDKRIIEAKNKLQELDDYKNSLNIRFIAIGYPIIVALILGIFVATTLLLDKPLNIKTIMNNFIISLIVCSFIYSIVIYLLKYRIINKSIKEYKISYDNLLNEKEQLMRSYENKYSKIYRLTYEYELHWHALDIVFSVKEHIKKHKNKSKEFIDKIKNYKQELNMLANNASEKSSSYFMREFPILNIEKHLNKKEIELEIKNFCRINSLQDIYFSFIESGNIDYFKDKIREFCKRLFKEMLDKPIDQYVFEAEKSDKDWAVKIIDQFVKASKALIRISAEKGEDKSEDIIALMIRESNNKSIRNIIRECGYCDKLRIYNNDETDSVEIIRFKIGFPAFHIAMLKYGKKLVQKTKDKSKVYIWPEREYEDIFPENYIEYDKNLLSVITLSKAFGIINLKKNGYYYNDHLLGKTKEQVIKELAVSKEICKELESKIEQLKEQADAATKLREFINSSKLDKDESKIIKEVLEELNPLA